MSMPALSEALALEQSVAAERAAVVLQLGPALSVRGGVSAVERLIVDHLAERIELRHIDTTEDGSPWRKMCVFARALRSFRAALRSDTRVLVHIHFASRGSTLRKWLLASMTLRAGRPLILHAHGAAFDRFFDSLPKPVQALLRRTFTRADYFLVLSSQWHAFYTQRLGVPAQRVKVLYNPTSLPKELHVRAGRTQVQFLFLGRIGQRKGAQDVLRAFARLPEDLRCRARLVFAGDGEVEALRSMAQAHAGAVEVHPWVDAVQRNALLKASDVFVLPSHHEGVPMALLEAMAFGLPVITTPVGGIPDVVKDGREGLLIEPGNIEQLTAAMRTLIEDEPRRLAQGRLARARAERFDVEHYATQLETIYRRALGRER